MNRGVCINFINSKTENRQRANYEQNQLRTLYYNKSKVCCIYEKNLLDYNLFPV